MVADLIITWIQLDISTNKAGGVVHLYQRFFIFPLCPQYLHNMLGGYPKIHVFCLCFSSKSKWRQELSFWPYAYASLTHLFMPNYCEDWLVMKGFHPRMNPLYLFKAVLTKWSLIFACLLSNLGQFDLMLFWYVYFCLSTMRTGW